MKIRVEVDKSCPEDEIIIRRVAKLADRRGVTMTEISLA